MVVKLQPHEDGAFIELPEELLKELDVRADEWVQIDLLDRSVEAEGGLRLPFERVIRIAKIRM